MATASLMTITERQSGHLVIDVARAVPSRLRLSPFWAIGIPVVTGWDRIAFSSASGRRAYLRKVFHWSG